MGSAHHVAGLFPALQLYLFDLVCHGEIRWYMVGLRGRGEREKESEGGRVREGARIMGGH